MRLAYAIPTFHNPTGDVMPEARRRTLRARRRDLGLTVVEDLTPGLRVRRPGRRRPSPPSTRRVA